MSTSVVLPALGESVTEGTVTRWLKKVGDTIQADEGLLEISTDKVDTEIPSPVSGVLEEILVQEDETVEVGAVLAKIGDGSSAPAESPAPAEAAPAQEAPAEQAPAEQAPAQEAPTQEAPAEQAPAASGGSGGKEVLLPELGESVTEGTVTRWLKQVGDSVETDAPLLEISTDKVDTEIPSPFSGVVQEILVKEDETVAVGAALARIGDSAAPAAGAPTEEVAPAPVAAGPATPEPSAPAQEAPAQEAPAPAQEAPAAPAPAAQAAVPAAQASAPAAQAPAPAT